MTAFATTFGIALLAAVLLSRLSARSPLSTSGIFLFAGLVAGPLVLDADHLSAEVVREIASVTLFAVLFSDGQRAPLSDLRRQWHDPARALLIGMPLTFAVVSVLAHLLIGLDWTTAMLIGAILAPTDPVFAAALVGRDDVPGRLRSLLNIESGLNDGIALPVVLVLVGTLGGEISGESTSLGPLLLEIAVGVVVGVAVPVAAAGLVRLPVLGVTDRAATVGPLAVAVLLYVLAETIHANPFIAAFVAGITTATVSPRASEAFAPVGELVSELSKNGALLAFGALITAELLGSVGVVGWVFAALVLLVGRPLPFMVALAGSKLPRREQLSAAWFGPKGFASVAYGLLVLSSGIEGADQVLALVAVTVVLSIAAHSATDTPVAMMLHEQPDPDPYTGARPDE